MLFPVFGVRGHVDHNRVVLWKTSFEIRLLPFELFVLRSERRDACRFFRVIAEVLFVRAPWKSKELQVHSLNKIKVSV